ncbi:MAG: hypothetical protein KBT68_00770, partial [bacterium]|nr:hypothetical protein [Candidatus Colisoma equi]
DPATVAEISHIILRNVPNAGLFSGCYTNGIGTIYFDAVNGSRCTAPEDYNRIEVEVVTNAATANLPLDEIPLKDWVRAEMQVFYRDGPSKDFVPAAWTNSFALAVTTGRTENYFYRICVPVNCRGAARFRIRRPNKNEKSTADDGSWILLDNIIVSYPGAGADMAPFGFYDKAKVRKQIIGQENAFIPPFPSVKDTAVFGRGTPTLYPDYMTQADPRGFIPLSKLHYRWRYLDQASNAWETVDLSPGDDFVSQAAFSLTNREGDVEFWYENCINAPYYVYFDYSGLGLGTSGLYSEERTTVTNGFDNPWFVRLRPGKSDVEAFRLYVKTAEEAAAEIVDMSLVGNDMWRGLYQTLDPVEGGDGKGLFVRFEALNRQVSGSTAFASNVTYYALAGDVTNLKEPSAIVPAPDSNRWSRVVCDAKTGHLLFQVAESTLGAMIVHAAYQDFNRWNDANVLEGGKPVFVGTSTDTNAVNMSGTSPVAREYAEDFGWWRHSLATNKYWTESFDDVDPNKAFKPFSEAETPNGFTVGPGQWVTGLFRDSDSGYALQMKGKGEGYIQFVNALEAPCGLESVVFRPRIGQAIEYGDFSYYDGDKVSLTNYTFFCRGAYDINNRQSFTGNASLSLVAFWRPGHGGYEFRVEQENATKSQTGEVAPVPGNKHRLSLYRWRFNDDLGEYEATLLGNASDVFEKSGMLTTSGETGSYALLFVSAKNTGTTTELVAGVSTGVGGISSTTSTECRWVSFVDSDADLRLKNGAYGVLSANCPARFRYLCFARNVSQSPINKNAGLQKTTKTFTFPKVGTEAVTCQDDLRNDAWSVYRQRMVMVDRDNSVNFGLKAKDVSQPLKVLVGPPGSTKASEYREILTTNITNFGSFDLIELKLWSLDECSVKIAAGGTATSARNDVVIDDLEFRQWRGESYDGKEGQKYFDDLRYGSPTNFVFTQAWITDDFYGDKVCRLSAKRSKLDEPTSIRSPLMDGESGRGKGLGMISFSYVDAQTNVNLLVQIATNNVTRGLFADITASTVDETEWTTVTNFSFAAATPQELIGGTKSVYLGLHDVIGAMRIVMDTNVVVAVAGTNVTDVTAFGEIDITGVVCRDEPKLDESSWWGWNIRTSDEDSRRYLWDETPTGLGRGMSFALNNSISADILDRDVEFYPQHLPFLQTPTFDADMIGEIAFTARKYTADDPDTRIVLFGTRLGASSDD